MIPNTGTPHTLTIIPGSAFTSTGGNFTGGKLLVGSILISFRIVSFLRALGKCLVLVINTSTSWPPLMRALKKMLLC